MKMVYATLATALTIALALPLTAQPKHDTTKTDMGKHDMSSMMGRPTFDATVDGLRLRGWIITQQEHNSMMNDQDTPGMKHEGMERNDTSMRMENSAMTRDTTIGMGKGTQGMTYNATSMGMDTKEMKHDDRDMDKTPKEGMMAGTHRLMIDATDVSTGKNAPNASGRVMIVSPTMKNSSVELMTVRSHFGNGLTLDEKGEYQFTVYINANGVSRNTQFKYTVK